jgi:tRNA (guanosine-2'-O-)-methyltransferase
MEHALRQELTTHLATFLTERRVARIEAVLAERTRRLAVVLEDVFQPHNASAVLRSCECFGVQDVHIVEGRNTYTVSRGVSLGAGQWLSLIRYRADEGRDISACAAALRQAGYRLVAATPKTVAPEEGTPGAGTVPVDELPVDEPLAVIFGTEEEGLTPLALELADERAHIPMYGFTGSFNVSVSAALILRELSTRMRVSPLDWGLSDDEKAELRFQWYRSSVRGCDLILERHLKERGLAWDQ